MDQRHTPGARMPRSSYMIWPGWGVSCIILMVSNSLSGMAHSKKMDGMDKLLWIYILNDVCLSSLYLPSHAEKRALWELPTSLFLSQTRGYRLYQDVWRPHPKVALLRRGRTRAAQP